jgi:hypothetical protein
VAEGMRLAPVRPPAWRPRGRNLPGRYALLSAALIVLSTPDIGRREAQLGKRPAVPRGDAEV